jgi:hypothetical protein
VGMVQSAVTKFDDQPKEPPITQIETPNSISVKFTAIYIRASIQERRFFFYPLNTFSGTSGLG